MAQGKWHDSFVERKSILYLDDSNKDGEYFVVWHFDHLWRLSLDFKDYPPEHWKSGPCGGSSLGAYTTEKKARRVAETVRFAILMQ